MSGPVKFHNDFHGSWLLLLKVIHLGMPCLERPITGLVMQRLQITSVWSAAACHMVCGIQLSHQLTVSPFPPTSCQCLNVINFWSSHLHPERQVDMTDRHLTGWGLPRFSRWEPINVTKKSLPLSRKAPGIHSGVNLSEFITSNCLPPCWFLVITDHKYVVSSPLTVLWAAMHGQRLWRKCMNLLEPLKFSITPLLILNADYARLDRKWVIQIRRRTRSTGRDIILSQRTLSGVRCHLFSYLRLQFILVPMQCISTM